MARFNISLENLIVLRMAICVIAQGHVTKCGLWVTDKDELRTWLILPSSGTTTLTAHTCSLDLGDDGDNS